MNFIMTVASKAHAAAQPIIQYIPTGVPYMTAIISGVVALFVGAGLGWYVRGRGMTGVQIDLNNIKTDVENIKTKIFPSTPAV